MLKIRNLIKYLVVICVQVPLVYIGYFATKRGNRKIVVGVIEIAGILYSMKQFFGDKCITFSKGSNPFYRNYTYDIQLRDGISKYFYSAFFFGRLAKNALFYTYLFNTTFLLHKEFEFKFLKNRKIPIVFNFLGSDIRSRKLFNEYTKSISFNTCLDYINTPYCEEYVEETACLADKYGSLVFSHVNDQKSYLKSPQYFFPPLIDTSKYNFCMDKFKNLNKIIILHAPSNPNIKGTPLVRSVISALKHKGYYFEYIELINVDNSIVIENLKKSHIVLNQFYHLIPGIFGLEAMANCNAVLMSGKHTEFPYAFNNAWLETEDWQLYDNLKFLLDNPLEISKYALNGYEYMTKNLTVVKAKEYVVTILNEKGLKID